MLYRVGNMLYTKPKPKPTRKCWQMQNWYETAFVDATMLLNFLICRFELFCQTIVKRDSNRSSSPLKYVSVLRELPNKPTIYENP